MDAAAIVYILLTVLVVGLSLYMVYAISQCTEISTAWKVVLSIILIAGVIGNAIRVYQTLYPTSLVDGVTKPRKPLPTWLSAVTIVLFVIFFILAYMKMYRCVLSYVFWSFLVLSIIQTIVGTVVALNALKKAGVPLTPAPTY